MPQSAQYWIHKLNLIPHPEGGYYRETYRSELSLAREALPPQFSGPRLVSTAIYFLLRAGENSHWHRIDSAEIWHWYAGGALELAIARVLQPNS